jgi:hypothetical protein
MSKPQISLQVAVLGTIIGILAFVPISSAPGHFASAAAQSRNLKITTHGRGGGLFLSSIENDMVTQFGLSVDGQELCIKILQYTTEFDGMTDVFECVQIDKGDFTTSKKLDRASLDTTVMLLDYQSAQFKTLDIHVTWNSQDKLQMSKLNIQVPGLHLLEHGACRPNAETTVSVKGDGLDINLSGTSGGDQSTAEICRSFTFSMQRT